MKKFVILALLVTTTLTVSFAADTASAGAPIYTITTTTPNGNPIRADEEIIYAGKSCNTMTAFDDFHSFGDDYVSVVAKRSALDSNTINEIAGSGRGCFKVDIVIGGRVVSTGPIALTWNQETQQYIAANPSSGTMNF